MAPLPRMGLCRTMCPPLVQASRAELSRPANSSAGQIYRAHVDDRGYRSPSRVEISPAHARRHGGPHRAQSDRTPARHVQFQPPAVSPDGIITLGEKAVAGMGLEWAKAVSQTEPIRLELLGTTEYDSDNQTRIRPLFRGRVDRVYAKVGQLIAKGEPLIEFYSTDLAEAKNACEIERIQWVYSSNLLKVRENLSKTNAISRQSYLEAQNDEMKNLREYEVARDKLLVYGLTEEEVAKVKDEVGSQKARMTFRSPASGIVIFRDVVPGNVYDDDDTLLVIEPLDHLWVWGNVFESDLDLIKLGQSWEIQFPFQAERLHGEVEYISNNVDPGTHAVRVRTSIANSEGRIKSDMLVRGSLEIPPDPNRTVVTRRRAGRQREQVLRLRQAARVGTPIPARSGGRCPRERRPCRHRIGFEER